MWPFKKNPNECFESWPIVRSKPIGKTYGRSISLLINNWNCHVTTVDVYEDGSIDCWGFVDLALFREKLRAKWVVPRPKTDQSLSVYNFGFTGVQEGAWAQTTRAISKEVELVVRRLNPKMHNLVDMHGSDTEERGNVRYAKLNPSDKKFFRRDETTAIEILAESVPVLRLTHGAFELTRLLIYSDGMCQIGVDRKLTFLRDLHSLFDQAVISNTAPAGSRIVLPGLGEFRATTDFGSVSIHDRLGEVHDKLNVLNERPSVIAICSRLFQEYETEPSQQTLEALRYAYEAVPTHLRPYCGDMDTKDAAIRAVLFAKADENDLA